MPSRWLIKVSYPASELTGHISDDLILVPSLPSLLSLPAPCVDQGDRKLRVTWYKTTFGIPNIQIISLFPLGE